MPSIPKRHCYFGGCTGRAVAVSLARHGSHNIITALIISAWIMWSAIEIFLKSSTELLDGIQDNALYARVIKAVESVSEVRQSAPYQDQTNGPFVYGFVRY